MKLLAIIFNTLPTFGDGRKGLLVEEDILGGITNSIPTTTKSNGDANWKWER